VYLFSPGVHKLKEREYLGTVQTYKINSDYAAAGFEGKVNLHMVSLSVNHLCLSASLSVCLSV